MLVDRTHRHRLFLLSGISALLAAVSAAATVFNLNMYGGVLPPEMRLGTLGLDIMSLLVAVALLGCLLALERGRERYWLLWIGLQGYLLYAYAIYAFGRVYTPLYFLYLAIVGLSAYGLAVFGRALNLRALRHWHGGRLPRRTMGVVLVLIAGLFMVAWSAMLLAAISQHVEVPAATVIVLDLAFSLPLLAIVGLLLFRKRPIGDVLAPGVFSMSAAITLAVAIGELLRPAFGERFSIITAAPYLLPGSVCLAFAVLAFKRIGPSITHAQ